MSRLDFAINHRYARVPRLEVVLHHNGQSVGTLALFDTGSEFSVFDTVLAQGLGIELEEAPYQYVVGIERHPIRCPRRSLHVSLFAGADHVTTTAASLLFMPDISVIDNIIGRDLLREVTFAMIHGRRELHLSLQRGD